MERIQLLQNCSNDDGQDHQENDYTVSGMLPIKFVEIESS